MRFDPPQHGGAAGSGVLFLRVPAASLGAREVPLRFVENGGHVEVLAPRSKPPRWAERLARASSVGWRIGDRRVAGTVEKVEEPVALEAILRRFASAFGDREVRSWFGGQVLGFRLEEGVRSGPGYPETVARYFDRLAPDYDATVESNPLDLYLREVSVRALTAAFGPEDRVLEIGCGTGRETLPVAELGAYVVATDVSAKMLSVLRAKVASAGLADRVAIRQVGARDLGLILEEFGPGSFDGAFSDFGALNCEPTWEGLPSTLHALVRPGGMVMLGIWNRFCLAEFALCLAAGRPRRALARLRTPVPVGESRYGIPVFARSPRETLAALRPGFELVRLRGLPVFLPPYDFGAGISPENGLWSTLREIDARFSGRFPLNRVGDHFLAELRRRP